MKKTLFLVRHGTVYNPNKVMYRRLPGFQLSEAGRKDAEHAAEFLKGQPATQISHSPLERTTETALIIQASIPAPLVVEERIIEWEEHETNEIVLERMMSFWQDWVSSSHTVGIAISHRDPIRCLLFGLTKRTDWEGMEDISQFPLNPGGIYRADYQEDGTVKVELLLNPEND